MLSLKDFYMKNNIFLLMAALLTQCTTTHAAAQKKRSFRDPKEDIVHTIETHLQNAITSILDTNTRLKETLSPAEEASDEPIILTSLMEQISLAGDYENAKKKNRIQIGDVLNADPITNIRNSCTILLDPETLSLTQMAKEFNNISINVQQFLTLIIETHAKNAYLLAEEQKEDDEAMPFIISTLMYAQILSTLLEKTAESLKSRNWEVAKERFFLAGAITDNLKQKMQTAISQSITIFEYMHNKKIEIIAHLELFQAFLTFFHQGIQELSAREQSSASV